MCIAFFFRVVVVAFKVGLLCYSFRSDVDWPAVPRSPDGRSRVEPAFPVLCSGRLWAEYSADSGCCEVSLNCSFVLLCSLFFVVLVSLHFPAVGCCCMLDGSTSWYCFGGFSSLRWFTWFGVCWVTAFLCYVLSSNRDDSFQKTKASLPFCRANCTRTVCTCMCLLCFLSKNENNNGFGTIGLAFFFFWLKACGEYSYYCCIPHCSF